MFRMNTVFICKQMSEEEYLRDVSLADVPFDGDFDDYDEDGDGFIEEQEFFNTVLAAVPMKDPDELSIPFDASDIDGTLSYSFCYWTHLSLASHKWDIGRQRSPRSDAAERGVWSGSTLFLLSSEISTKHDNNKT